MPAGKLVCAAFDLAARGEIPFAPLKSKALHISSLRLVGRYDGAAHHLALDHRRPRRARSPGAVERRWRILL